MRLTNLQVQNYKALLSISLPLSRFVCVTGENNGGKSSILQALTLFASGSKLEPHHYFDPTQNIEITVRFEEVADGDLARLKEAARRKVRDLIDEQGAFTLTRRFAPDGSSELGYYALTPTDERYTTRLAADLVGKKGAAIRKTLEGLFPEREGFDGECNTITAAKSLVEAWADELPNDQKSAQFRPIPTGADFSISPLLPEVIYIPAVKDLKDDVKTTQSSSFGKVLGIVMKRIEDQLSAESDVFERLREKLTRVQVNGQPEDKRLAEIKQIEATIEKYVRESFAEVRLELDIPPPEIRSVLSTATIVVDDGNPGPLEQKGDGLRRAVVFAVLRTYLALSAKDGAVDDADGEGAKPLDRGYLLLFEEPELFLHPDAQRVLFEALGVFAKSHHVVVTTHSPIFLGPDATATFVRVAKRKPASGTDGKSFTVATQVDLTGLDPKDEFQLICFENNNAAFFAKKVVLVEGDSEMIVFPHVAQTLDSSWTCPRHSVAFVKTGGKGSTQRYRSFFDRFGLPTYVICDCDALLDGFDKLLPTPEEVSVREQLIRMVDAEIAKSAATEVGDSALKRAQKRGDFKALWGNATAAHEQFLQDPSTFPVLATAVDDFFAWHRKSDRLEQILNPATEQISEAKALLLAHLRRRNVFLLNKGAIEDYYPDGVVQGRDKPSKAQSFRNQVATQAAILACGEDVTCPLTGETVNELHMICRAIFDPADSETTVTE